MPVSRAPGGRPPGQPPGRAARAARAQAGGERPSAPDPKPSPYLPQHFPAVGTDQVVGGGRRAAAAPVHRGCGHRGRAAGPGRGCHCGRLRRCGSRTVPAPPAALLRRDIGRGGDDPRAGGAVRGAHRGGCRSDGGDGGGCSSPARCSTRPHPPDPRPRLARTSSRHHCLRRRRRRSASVRPRPCLLTTFTTSRSGTAPSRQSDSSGHAPGRSPAAYERLQLGRERRRPITEAEDALNLWAS